MKFSKKILMPILALTVTGLLAGCQEQNPTPENVTVTFWNHFYGDDQVNWLDQKVKEFNDSHKNITVIQEPKGKYADIKGQLDTLINTPDKLPSIAVVYPDYVVDYLDRDLVLDMDPFMNDSQTGFGKTLDENGNVIEEKDTLASDMNEAYLKEGQNFAVAGTYSLPLIRTSEVMYYNSTVFEKNGYAVPTTWSEMINLARQMRTDYPELYTEENKGNAGSGAVAPIGYDSYDNLYITFSEMMDIPYGGSKDENGDGRINKSEAVKFNNAEARQMVKMIKSWYDEGLITVKDTLVHAEPGNHWINEPFTAQESFMVLNSTTGSSWCATDEFMPKVAAMPSIDKNILSGKEVTSKTAKVMSQGPSVCFFDKSEAENQAAWEFYKFITNTNNSGDLAVVLGGSPARNSSFETTVIQDAMKYKDESTVKNGNGDTSDESNYMFSNIYDIYSSYSKNNQGFIAPVSSFSSATRTAVGNLLLEVLKSNKTGEELDKFIDDTFNQAYESI